MSELVPSIIFSKQENIQELNMSSSLRFLVILAAILQLDIAHTFLLGPTPIAEMKSSGIIRSSAETHFHGGIVLRMSDGDDDNYDKKSRLRDLGYSDDEIERSIRKPVKGRPQVRVDMVDNVDATTLTAVGFALIAFNFFVLANVGDGGIGGIVARIINSF